MKKYIAIFVAVVTLFVVASSVFSQGVCLNISVWGTVHTDDTHEYIWASDAGTGMDVELWGLSSGNWYYLETQNTQPSGYFNFQSIVACGTYKVVPTRPAPPDNNGIMSAKKFEFTITQSNQSVGGIYFWYDEPN